MVRRKTPESEYIQKRCVIPARREKENEFKRRNLAGFVTQSLKEEYCKVLREKAKK